MIGAVKEDAERLLTVLDVAHRLGVRTSWVYQHAESGTLPSIKVGRYLRFETSAIVDYIEASRRGPRRE